MTQTNDIHDLKRKLKAAEKANLENAADLYRDRIAALEANNEGGDDVEGETEPEAADEEADPDPRDSALYAALTGKPHSKGEAALSEGERAEALVERAETAEQLHMGGAAEHYREQAAALGADVDVDPEDAPDVEVALAAADEPGASERVQRAAELTEKEQLAVKRGHEGAARHYRQKRANLE